MKILGYLVGLLIALGVWIGSFFLVSALVARVPPEFLWMGRIAGLAALAAGAIGGRKAWKLTISYFENVGRQATRRRAARQAETERRVREESQRRADQRWLASNLQRRLESSHAVSESLPALIHSTERALDLAEMEFTSGLFVPFWDAIESAVNNLATFNSHLELLTSNARHYYKDGSRLETPPPPFTLGLPELPDVGPVAERLRAITYWSHSSHEFSSLFELRKSNRVSAGGFSNLEAALSQLATRLERASKELMESLVPEIGAAHGQADKEPVSGELPSIACETPPGAVR